MVANPSTRNRELYVEGGGDHNPSLATECRRAFSKLFEKAGVVQKPRVIACGGRGRAYKQFSNVVSTNETEAWLLVDAEELPNGNSSQSPWDHVAARPGDRWARPSAATDEQLQLMSACMETWLVADVAALQKVFGSSLDASKLPSVEQLESTDKTALYKALEAATKPTKAGPYGKGPHSFKVLAEVSPAALRRLAWGKRFLDAMGATK